MGSPQTSAPYARRLGIVTRALGLVSLVGLGGWLWLTPIPPDATSSSRGRGDPMTDDAFWAIDGNPHTQWLLPDNAPGHFDVTFDEPQRIRELRLLNAYRAEPDRRATRDYRIELFAGGAVVHTVEGRWPLPTGAPQWVRHEMALPSVDRIRVHVVTWFPLGGGIAELRWAPRY